jgi:hypothetical protein
VKLLTRIKCRYKESQAYSGWLQGEDEVQVDAPLSEASHPCAQYLRRPVPRCSYNLAEENHGETRSSRKLVGTVRCVEEDALLPGLLIVRQPLLATASGGIANFQLAGVGDFPNQVNGVETVSPYRAVNTLSLGYTNQPVNAVLVNSRCMFSDPHNTHRYTVWAER